MKIHHRDSLEEVGQRSYKIISDPKKPDLSRELAMEGFNMEKAIDRYLDIYERMTQ